MQVQATVYVFMELGYAKCADGSTDYSREEWRPAVWPLRVDDQDNRVFISEQQVTVEVPDDFNPVPAQVAALEAQKAAALAEYQKAVAQINDRLSKLLALSAH